MLFETSFEGSEFPGTRVEMNALQLGIALKTSRLIVKPLDYEARAAIEEIRTKGAPISPEEAAFKRQLALEAKTKADLAEMKRHAEAERLNPTPPPVTFSIRVSFKVSAAAFLPQALKVPTEQLAAILGDAARNPSMVVEPYDDAARAEIARLQAAAGVPSPS